MFCIRICSSAKSEIFKRRLHVRWHGEGHICLYSLTCHIFSEAGLIIYIDNEQIPYGIGSLGDLRKSNEGIGDTFQIAFSDLLPVADIGIPVA